MLIKLLRLIFLLYISKSFMASASELVSMSNVNKFETSVTVVSNGNEIFDNWENPTGKPFQISSVKFAKRGVFLSTIILFKNCKADMYGNCNSIVDIIAYDPNGKIYGQIDRDELWQSKRAPSPGFSQLSLTYMGLVIEPKDPPGTYKIVVIAKDLISGAEAKSETQFDVK